MTRMIRSMMMGLAVALGLAGAHGALAQSSSLRLSPPRQPAPAKTFVPAQSYRNGNGPPALAPAIKQNSLLAVSLPEAREYKLHDLVTIVVSESTKSDVSAELETGKETTIEGKISEFPRLIPSDILQFQLSPSKMSDGEPEVKMEFEKEFSGGGDYTHEESFTTRLTARIIDIKPNGTLVLEARKFIKTEDESMRLTLTGTCRREDISFNNTILSTQLYDLHLVKANEGEIRKSTKKGILTKIFEGIFAF